MSSLNCTIDGKFETMPPMWKNQFVIHIWMIFSYFFLEMENKTCLAVLSDSKRLNEHGLVLEVKSKAAVAYACFRLKSLVFGN